MCGATHTASPNCQHLGEAGVIARAGSGHLGPRLPSSPCRDIDIKCLCHGSLQNEESDSSEILSPIAKSSHFSNEITTPNKSIHRIVSNSSLPADSEQDWARLEGEALFYCINV